MTSLTGLSIADGIAVGIGMHVSASASSSNHPAGLPASFAAVEAIRLDDSRMNQQCLHVRRP
jgi:hypothetical protein